MIRWILSVILATVLAFPAAASINQADQVIHALEKSELDRAIQADAAIKAALLWAAFNLDVIGEHQKAEQLRKELQEWEGYLTAMVLIEDLGSHEPLSMWLAVWIGVLEGLLGPQLFNMLHLDDLKIINYAIPVVFDPRMESGKWNHQNPKAEYKLHFVPFAGVCAYWGTWIGCTAATWGAGAIAMICTPVSMLSERIMVNRIAPPMSDRVYDRANN